MGEPKGFLVVPIGYNPSGALRALELDTDDNLKIAFAAAAQGPVGDHGWIDGAWQKQPIFHGYSARINDRWQGVSDGVNSTQPKSTIVPAGEFHVINFVSTFHNDPTARSINVYAYDGTNNFEIATYSGIGGNVVQVLAVEFVLGPGDRIMIWCPGLASTQIIYGRLWGRRVDIDQ